MAKLKFYTDEHIGEAIVNDFKAKDLDSKSVDLSIQSTLQQADVLQLFSSIDVD